MTMTIRLRNHEPSLLIACYNLVNAVDLQGYSSSYLLLNVQLTKCFLEMSSLRVKNKSYPPVDATQPKQILLEYEINRQYCLV